MRPATQVIMLAVLGLLAQPRPASAASTAACHGGAAEAIGRVEALAGPLGHSVPADAVRTTVASAHEEHEVESAEWAVKGRYLDACRCNAPCPCHFGIRADYDSCDPTLVFRIEEGRAGEVELGGLSTVVVATAERVWIYLDAGADASQRRALERVARGLSGTLLRDGFTLPAEQSVTVAPIDARFSDEAVRVTISGAVELRAVALGGGDGSGRIFLANLDLGPAWMRRVWSGRSETYRVAAGEGWDYSGRNAYFGEFVADAAMIEAARAASARR